jgi:hypothetical protein
LLVYRKGSLGLDTRRSMKTNHDNRLRLPSWRGLTKQELKSLLLSRIRQDFEPYREVFHMTIQSENGKVKIVWEER